jgi:hypothetical protein
MTRLLTPWRVIRGAVNERGLAHPCAATTERSFVILRVFLGNKGLARPCVATSEAAPSVAFFEGRAPRTPTQRAVGCTQGSVCNMSIGQTGSGTGSKFPTV